MRNIIYAVDLKLHRRAQRLRVLQLHPGSSISNCQSTPHRSSVTHAQNAFLYQEDNSQKLHTARRRMDLLLPLSCRLPEPSCLGSRQLQSERRFCNSHFSPKRSEITQPMYVDGLNQHATKLVIPACCSSSDSRTWNILLSVSVHANQTKTTLCITKSYSSAISYRNFRNSRS